MIEMLNDDVGGAVDGVLSPLKTFVEFATEIGLYVAGVLFVLSLIVFVWSQKADKPEVRDKAKNGLIGSVIVLGILMGYPLLLELLGITL